MGGEYLRGVQCLSGVMGLIAEKVGSAMLSTPPEQCNAVHHSDQTGMRALYFALLKTAQGTLQAQRLSLKRRGTLS